MRQNRRTNTKTRAKRTVSAGLTSVAVLALAVVVYSPVFGDSSTVLITQAVDDSKLSILMGNTRPEAVAANDVGPVPDSFPMNHLMLQLKRAPVLESALEQYIDQLSDKSSPNYHKWLSPQQMGEQYGLAKQDLTAVQNWLRSHGFTVGHVYENGVVIDFSGDAGMIRAAFHTDIHYLTVNGESHFSNMSDPQIPAALAGAVAGVTALHDFKPHPMFKRVPKLTFGGCSYAPLPTIPSNCYALVPSDYQTIYNLNPLFRQGLLGQGQTIVVVDDSDSYSNDVATYRSTFLSKYSGTFVTTHPGSCADPGDNSDDSESNIDAEIAGAIAPDATIDLATCSSVLTAIQNLVNGTNGTTVPSVMSISYGECETRNGAANNLAYYTAYQTGAAEGVSIFVSSGDESATSCSADADYSSYGIGVSGYTSTPYNVSVGGTDYMDTYLGTNANYWSSTNLSTYGSAVSYIPEMPWNDSCSNYEIYNYLGYSTGYGASGFCQSSIATTSDDYLDTGSGSGGPSGCATGAVSTSRVVSGTCLGYPKPSWQKGIFGNPADGVRDIPDVSNFAANGDWGHYVVVCYSHLADEGVSCAGTPDTWAGFGGTSISSPVQASIQALINQKWGSKMGNPDPVFYQIANAEFGANGNSNCYSINQPAGRRGLGTDCAFYDITQGDMEVNCLASSDPAGCYLPDSSANGSTTTGPVGAITVVNPGSNYTSAPACTLAAPANLSPYLSPTGATLWPGGTQATCTASVGSVSQVGTISLSSGTVSTSWAGATVTVGSTVYTFATGTLTTANQVLLNTSNGTTGRSNTLRNLSAAINANNGLCATSGCYGPGTVANTSATASGTSSPITVTALTSGAAGDFALSDTNAGSSTFATAITIQGASNVISSITVTNGGSGYTAGSGCTISGGGGSGATCSPQLPSTTAAASYQPAFGATPGWDMATGLGSVNAYNLVMNTAW
jgi:subtilase family serine protease